MCLTQRLQWLLPRPISVSESASELQRPRDAALSAGLLRSFPLTPLRNMLMVTPVIQARLLLSNKHVAVKVTHMHKQVFWSVSHLNIFLSLCIIWRNQITLLVTISLKWNEMCHWNISLKVLNLIAEASSKKTFPFFFLFSKKRHKYVHTKY